MVLRLSCYLARMLSNPGLKRVPFLLKGVYKGT